MANQLTRTAWAAALLGSAVAGLTYPAYRRDIQSARARVKTGSRLVETALGAIEYAAQGRGAALLVVHGAGGGFDQGMAFGENFTDRFHVIAPSRFGYLRTPLPQDASPQAQADAHAALLDTLNINQCAIIGVSAGAPSAMQFALRYPQRTKALVLVVPAAYVPRGAGAASLKTPPLVGLLSHTALRSDFLFWTATKLARDTVLRAIFATPPDVVKRAPVREQARVQRLLDLILPVSVRRLGLINDAAICSTLPRYHLERIVAPTLAVSLEDDLFGTYDTARYTAGQIRGARFVGYPGGGHVWVGHHEELVSEIAAFLG